MDDLGLRHTIGHISRNRAFNRARVCYADTCDVQGRARISVKCILEIPAKKKAGQSNRAQKGDNYNGFLV